MPVDPFKPAIVRAAEDLKSLKDEFIKEEGSRADQLAKARRQGQRLIKMKKLCGHGNWLRWLDANLPVSQRQANSYMRFFKLEVTSNLSDDERWHAWQTVQGNIPADEDQPAPEAEEDEQEQGPEQPEGEAPPPKLPQPKGGGKGKGKAALSEPTNEPQAEEDDSDEQTNEEGNGAPEPPPKPKPQPLESLAQAYIRYFDELVARVRGITEHYGGADKLVGHSDWKGSTKKELQRLIQTVQMAAQEITNLVKQMSKLSPNLPK